MHPNGPVEAAVPRASSAIRKWKRRSVAIVTAALFLFSGVDAGYAQSLGSPQASSPSGVAALVRLKVPFGRDPEHRSRATLSLVGATEWRDARNGFSQGGARYGESVEAGFSLSGAPVFRFGGRDMLERQGFGLNANARDDGGVPNWAWWGLAGVAVLGGVAFFVARDAADDFRIWH